jgi:hypothetical protein
MTAAADPVAVLVKAWITWDRAAAALSTMKTRPTSATLRAETYAKEAAITALGLDTNRFHRIVAAHRRRAVAGQPDGLPIPDAIWAALIELGAAPETITPTDLKEAS